MKHLKWLGRAVLALGLIIGIVVLVGFALPQDHVASRTVTLNRPIADVWTVITDVESFPSWRASVSRVELLGRQPLRWREVSGGDALTLEIVESKPPTRLVTEIADTDLPFGGRWVYDLRPSGNGTELTITEHGEVYNPVFRFVSRFIMGHSATIDAYMTDLQKKLS